MADSYRPSRRPPARGAAKKPLVDRMTFQSGGGDTYRPGEQRRQQNGTRDANHAEFTFTSSHQAPQFAPTGPANFNEPGPRRKNKRGGASARVGDRDAWRGDDTMPSYGGARNNANGFRRGGRRQAPHERALLQARDDTTEQVLGVPDGQNKFRNVDDLSDHDEAAMDFDSDIADGDSSASDGPNANHKVARKHSSDRADGDSVPKWSNPDPYTVLPPPEETTGKRVDFVKLIRKAKNEVLGNGDDTNAVAANDDFISFGEDDDADKDAAMDDEDPPLAPWARSSADGSHIHGSLNEVTAEGALPPTGPGLKRSAEVAGLPERPQHPGKASKRKLGVSIVEQWEPIPAFPSAPWTGHESYAHLSREPLKWLHNEILDFCDYVAPKKHEDDLRHDLIRRVQQTMGRQLLSWPSASIQCFGSFPAGLYLPTADMDLVYASEQFQRHGTPAIFPQKNQLWKVARKLEQKGVAMNIAVIAHAKVPIIKFKDRVTGLPVDISFENLGGVDAQANFRDWIHDYPDMVHLVALVKQFLVMRELNEVNTGGLGGFSIICLVVSFLQNSPKEENLAKAFINFLDFYGNKFDISRQRIIMRPPGAVQKGKMGIDGRQEKPTGLSIQDPNRPDNNISGGSYKAVDILKAFSDAHAALTERMRAIEHGTVTSDSILEAIIGGNYSSYIQHREHMDSLNLITDPVTMETFVQVPVLTANTTTVPKPLRKMPMRASKQKQNSDQKPEQPVSQSDRNCPGGSHSTAIVIRD